MDKQLLIALKPMIDYSILIQLKRFFIYLFKIIIKSHL